MNQETWRDILLLEEILHHLGYTRLASNGINLDKLQYISTGAGFLTSTVFCCLSGRIYGKQLATHLRIFVCFSKLIRLVFTLFSVGSGC